MEIRELTKADWAQVWPIVRDVVRAQETFPYDPAMTEQDARDIWIEPPPGLTVVAVDDDRIVGTGKMGTNRPGPGSHVSTASFMVAADTRGRGVGAALCRFALDWARDRGYAGMQFNAVGESNQVAVDLYKRLGFRVVGTVPGAFEHPAWAVWALKADFWAIFDVGDAEPGDAAIAVATRQAAEFAAKRKTRYPAAVACVVVAYERELEPHRRPRVAHRAPAVPCRALEAHPALELHRAHLR